MRRWFRRFTLVGLWVTAADVAILAVARLAWISASIVIADAWAVGGAAFLSYHLHRRHTFADDPRIRLVQSPGTFARIAALGLVIDVAVVWALSEVWPLWAAKGIALALAGAVRVVLYRRHLFVRVRFDQSQRPVDRAAAPGEVRFSVVIPAFREAERIGAAVQEVRAALAGVDLEVVVVDDGSDDDTAAAARAAGADNVIVLAPNQGKGAAVRAGMLAARGRVRAFTDADLAYPPAQLARLLAEVEDGWDVVVGSRRHIDTIERVKRGRLREVAGEYFNTLTFLVLLGQYRDTQCGLKAFRSDAAARMFSATRVDGFAFDVELFYLAERYRLSLKEVPVELSNTQNTSVRVALDAARMIRDLLRIRWLASSGAYDTPAN